MFEEYKANYSCGAETSLIDFMLWNIKYSIYISTTYYEGEDHTM